MKIRVKKCNAEGCIRPADVIVWWPVCMRDHFGVKNPNHDDCAQWYGTVWAWLCYVCLPGNRKPDDTAVRWHDEIPETVPAIITDTVLMEVPDA